MRWKWIVAIGAFLVVTLIAGIYVILKSDDYNKLKPRIARMVERATGRELNLSGDVNLDFGFSPALVVTDVTFANAPWGSQPQMIKIGKLKAQAQLLPLLFGDVELKQITLAGVDVLIETDRTGRGNWHFPAADSSAKKAGSFKVLKIELDQLRIENLHLAYRNGETESTTRFTLAGLDLDKQAQLDALKLNLRGTFNDQPVALSGRIGLINRIIARKRFPLELSGQFSKATVKIKGAIEDVLSLHGIDIEVRASGTDLAYPVFFAGAMFLAAGTAIFKPGLQGLIANQMPKRNAAFGWGLFYQMVNIGGFIGPLLAGYLRILESIREGRLGF